MGCGGTFRFKSRWWVIQKGESCGNARPIDMINLDGICPVFYPFVFVGVCVVLIFVAIATPFMLLFRL